MGFQQIDDYTVQYTFTKPYYVAVEAFGTSDVWAPAHRLLPYMPVHNDDAEGRAQEEGFDSWQEAIYVRSGGYNSDPTTPQINPWIIKERGAGSVIWERNPYYFKVDTAGNQLPYIDTILHLVSDDVGTAGPRLTMAGELDLSSRVEGLALADIPELRDHEQEGDYKTYLWPDRTTSSAYGFALNFLHQDPVRKAIFNDLRCRQALSLGINRDEISDIVFSGLTAPWTAPMSSLWTGYEEWMGVYYADHDVQQANALLDEMGLAWDDAHEYRLRPDGETFLIHGDWTTDYLEYTQELLDLIALHWKEIGVRFEPRFEPFDEWHEATDANETDVGMWSSDGGSEFIARTNYPIRLMPQWHWRECCGLSSLDWRIWLDTDGAEGVESPDEIQQVYQLVQQWLVEPAGTEAYERLIKEIMTLNVENMWFFGTVTAPPYILTISSRVRNHPGEDGFTGGAHLAHVHHEMWYIRQ